MTKAELVEEVSRVSDLTKKHSEVIVDTVFQSIIDALHRGEKIELRGFGSFRLRKREPRKGRNPKTGDKVDVPPKRVPYFKPGKELKDLINRGDGERRATRSDGSGGLVAAALTVRAVERLWSPWRHAYVTRGSEPDGCIFCAAPETDDGRALLVHAGVTCYVILNLYPVQRRPPDGGAAPPRRRRSTGCTTTSWSRSRGPPSWPRPRSPRPISPQGMNVGLNLGRPAGAGVADHLHVHLVPRWNGDTNFMPVVGNVRVLPEDLFQTAGRLRPVFARLAAAAVFLAPDQP